MWNSIADQIWISPGLHLGLSWFCLQVVFQQRSLQAGKSVFDSSVRECLKKMKFELQTTNIHNRILIWRITPSQPQGRAATTWLLKCHLQHLDFESSLPNSSQAILRPTYFWLLIPNKGCIWKFTCCPCYSCELFLVVERMEKSKLRSRSLPLRFFSKDPFCARELELGLNAPLKSGWINPRLLPFWFFKFLTCYVNIFYVTYTAALREKKRKKTPLCPFYKLV